MGDTSGAATIQLGGWGGRVVTEDGRKVSFADSLELAQLTALEGDGASSRELRAIAT